MWFVILIISVFVIAFIYELIRQSRSKSFQLDKNLKDIDLKLSYIKVQNRDWEEKFNTLISYVDKGREFEKSGDIDNAILEYERAVAYGARNLQINNYYQSVRRLLVLYRKKKDFKNELSLIERMLKEDISNKDKDELNYRKGRVLTITKQK
jgi:tetratricopeptide (TPR) repeat protein